MLLLLLVRSRVQQRGAAGPDQSGAGVGATVAVSAAVGVGAAVAVGTAVGAGAAVPEPPRGGARRSRACAAAAAAMEVQVAPLRAWDDFFPGSDRFALPDLKDISKWNNRVVSNLLYYQTNYLMVAAALVSIVGSVRGLAVRPGRAGGVGWSGPGPRAGALRPGPVPRERSRPAPGGMSGYRGGGAAFSLPPFSFSLFPRFPLTLFHSPFPFSLPGPP